MNKYIKDIILGIIFPLVVLAVSTFTIMYLWNGGVSTIFELSQINFAQAFVLDLFISRCTFKVVDLNDTKYEKIERYSIVLTANIFILILAMIAFMFI